MKNIFVIAVLSLAGLAATAQTVNDALLFSQTNYNSTARSAGMSGAFGALGGDFASISINPAGLGIYRSGEVSFTPTLDVSNTSASYLGTTSDDYRIGIRLNNFGMVFAVPTINETGIMSLNFGIGYNRLKSFNTNTFIMGSGSTLSRTDEYALDLNAYGLDKSLWESFLAYDSYLVNDRDGFTSILTENVPVDQKMSIYEKGRIDEWNFSMAMNINHKLYFGASIGLHDLYYRKEMSYVETFGRNAFDETYIQYYNDDAITFRDGGFKSSQYQTTSGYGVVGKFGAIFRPVDPVRFGLSVHTPTYYYLTDNYSYSVDPDILVPTSPSPDDDVRPDIQSKDGLASEYILSTSPFKLNASVAYQLGKAGILSVDYELADYSNMKFRERKQNDGGFTPQNTLISEVYGLGSSIRAGLELKPIAQMSLRGGFSHTTSPYTDKADSYSFVKPGSINQFSLGLGYRDSGFFFDLAYVLQRQKISQSLFILDNNYPLADITLSANKIMMTFGFRF